MNNELKLALQLSFIDIASAGLNRMRQNIRGLGSEAKEVQKNFDLMERSLTRGLKAVAVFNYGVNKLKPGIAAAAGMQEATLDVKMNLQESHQNAGELAKQLATVRATAVDIQKQMPFGAQEVMGIENVLLKAGLGMKDVTAKGGAAWAAAALATISKESPQAMGEGLIAMAAPFNVKGGQFGEMANFIQKVDQASVTTIPEIVEGMKYVSGTAANMKVSWQETLLAMGTMSQQGLRGSMAGTSLNDFLIRMVGTSRIERRVLAALNSELTSKGKAPLVFFDQAGKLKSLPAIINNLRNSLDGLTDHKRMFVLQKIFGEQGARAAFALIHQGAGSWEEVAAGVNKAADAQTKLNTRMEGFNAIMKSLMGTSATTAASFFDPWLVPLHEITSGVNDAIAALGKFADNHPKTVDTVNGVLAAGIAAAAGYAGYQLIKGGIAGAHVLKGLKGLSSTGLGIAEGKMVQAATGVTPVFVTNWPGGFGGVGGDTIIPPGGGKALPWLTGAATMSGATVLAALAALVAGYAAGTAIERSFIKGKIGEGVYDLSHGLVPERDLATTRLLQGVNSQNPLLPKNEIKVDIHIDGQGRVFTQTNGTNNSIQTMKRGTFFDQLTTAGMGF